MQRRILIARHRGGRVTAVEEDGRIAELWAEAPESEVRVGDVYVARVTHVAKNLEAAFVDLSRGQNAFLPLRGGLPLRAEGDRGAREGDSVLVQVEREPHAGKPPSLSAAVSLAGELTVVSCPGAGVRYSRKIPEGEWKEFMRGYLPAQEGFGIIVRTEAPAADVSSVRMEADALRSRLEEILSAAPHRPCYSVLRRGRGYRDAVCERWLSDPETAEVVIEEEDVFAEVTRAFPLSAHKCRLYRDDGLEMSKAYRFEKAFRDASDKRVWLKSGAYLVIEPTEAMTVIDINTGKDDRKRSKDRTVRELASEAAREIAFQMRLRNLSGIVSADFPDLPAPEAQEVLREMQDLLDRDPVRAEAVDFTRLGILEMTRRRIRRPFAEQMRWLDK